MKTATFRNSWGLVFPFSSQSVIPPEGRSRPVAAKGGLRPGVYAGFCRRNIVRQVSPVYGAPAQQGKRPVNGPDRPCWEDTLPGVNALFLPTSFGEKNVVLREIRSLWRSAPAPADENGLAGPRVVPVGALFPVEFGISLVSRCG